jgi:hypothetical protein
MEISLMAHEQPSDVSDKKAHAMAFLSFAEATVTLQREMLQTYERLGRAWLDRIQTEVELWNGLAKCLASSKSVAESLNAYTDCMAKQIQMSAEDGRHLMSDYHEITQKIAKVVAADKHAIHDPGPAPESPAEHRVTH